MDIVKIDKEKYSKYLHDKNYIISKLKRYYDWIFKYKNNGEVAFYHFILKPDGYGSCVFCASYEKETEEYGLIIYIPMETENVRNLYPIKVWMNELNDAGLVDCYVEIDEQDEAWQRVGINDINDLDKESRDWIILFSFSGFALFAEIQTNAMKCHRKIIHLQKRTKSKSTTTSISSYKYRPIILSPGVTYSYENTPSTPRNFIRHCEAWNVRGHYRHCKSGKIVYVRPHQKGKGKLKQTIYELPE